jgi:hypothetical protein
MIPTFVVKKEIEYPYRIIFYSTLLVVPRLRSAARADLIQRITLPMSYLGGIVGGNAYG